jgi:hypothetical protein
MAIGASDKGCKILGIILFWASVVVVAFTVKTGLETSAQAKWPTVEGNLIKAEFREVIEKKNSGQANDEENELIKNRYWIPEFEYEYRINQHKYVGNRISTFDSTCHDESDVMDLRRLILRNDKIKVYYNPENPEFSVINPFPSLFDIWIVLTLAIIAGSIGILMYFVCRNG